MEYCPGQRWISESHPEKGLGLILKYNEETVTVIFPAVDETLTYASKSAPLRRVIFDIGDTIELQVDLILSLIRPPSLKALFLILLTAGK